MDNTDLAPAGSHVHADFIYIKVSCSSRVFTLNTRDNLLGFGEDISTFDTPVLFISILLPTTPECYQGAGHLVAGFGDQVQAPIRAPHFYVVITVDFLGES